MDVLPVRESLDQARGRPRGGRYPQLDLVVVGHEQPPPLLGEERPPESAAFLGPDRDVVQVWFLGRQPTRAGDGLMEGGVDPTVGRDGGEERLAIGRAELLDLAVAKELLDDLVLVTDLLEALGVGRKAGLRLLARLQAELVEQDLAQLRRGVDDEGVTGELVDTLLPPSDLGGQLVEDRSQVVEVDADADDLHLREHPDERDARYRRTSE